MHCKETRGGDCARHAQNAGSPAQVLEDLAEHQATDEPAKVIAGEIDAASCSLIHDRDPPGKARGYSLTTQALDTTLDHGLAKTPRDAADHPLFGLDEGGSKDGPQPPYRLPHPMFEHLRANAVMLPEVSL